MDTARHKSAWKKRRTTRDTYKDTTRNRNSKGQAKEQVRSQTEIRSPPEKKEPCGLEKTGEFSSPRGQKKLREENSPSASPEKETRRRKIEAG